MSYNVYFKAYIKYKQSDISLSKKEGRNMSKYIIKVTRPELTPEERAKRMEQIKQAAIRLIVESERLGIRAVK